MSTKKPRAIPQFPHLVGFDQLFEQITRPSRQLCYPPHNIVKVAESGYSIELAVAGFTMDNLKICLEDRVLNITGTPYPLMDAREYIYKGLSSRKFTKKFDLADNVEVNGASLSAGILTVKLVVTGSKSEPITIDIVEET